MTHANSPATHVERNAKREFCDFIPFRQGDTMTEETRSRFMTAFGWQPLMTNLGQLGRKAQQVEVRDERSA